MNDVKTRAIQIFTLAGLPPRVHDDPQDGWWHVEVNMPGPNGGRHTVEARRPIDATEVSYCIDGVKMPIRDFEGFEKVFEVFLSSATWRPR